MTEGAAAVCAVRPDSPISDLLLSVHLNSCRQNINKHSSPLKPTLHDAIDANMAQLWSTWDIFGIPIIDATFKEHIDLP